jgi:hypothetical protein
VLTRLLEEWPATYAGEQQIEHDQVGPAVAEQPPRLKGVAWLQHPVTGLVPQVGHQVSKWRIILDHEDVARRGSGEGVIVRVKDRVRAEAGAPRSLQPVPPDLSSDRASSQCAQEATRPSTRRSMASRERTCGTRSDHSGEPYASSLADPGVGHATELEAARG